MTVDGIAKSMVPSLSFFIISLSLPSWLEPYTVTFALPASLALTRLANSSACAPINEPGSPTWPSLISVSAEAGPALSVAAAAVAMKARRLSGMRNPPLAWFFRRT